MGLCVIELLLCGEQAAVVVWEAGVVRYLSIEGQQICRGSGRAVQVRSALDGCQGLQARQARQAQAVHRPRVHTAHTSVVLPLFARSHFSVYA